MLINPFTPSEIASIPENFFGRREELSTLERSIKQGSVAIQGTVGIGKSSILSQLRMILEGFGSGNDCETIITIGTRDIKTSDDLAKNILEQFALIDTKSNKIGLGFKGVSLQWESQEVCSYFNEGRHLAALQKILKCEHLRKPNLFVIAIDEADKCPVSLARLIRSVSTYVQHEGINNLRFIVAGVSPFFRRMIDEDEGVSRFFYENIVVTPMRDDESMDLLVSKFELVVKDAEEKEIPLTYELDTLEQMVSISGGHPHLLQLLGSHIVEHENGDPDGSINSRDLLKSFKKICYKDRAHVYNSLIHSLDIDHKLEPLKELFAIASSKCPTRIKVTDATDILDVDMLEYFVERNILIHLNDEYALTDEFLRIRLLMDEDNVPAKQIETQLIYDSSYISDTIEWREDWKEYYESEE